MYRGPADRGRGLADQGRGLADRGRGLADRGRGLADQGRGLADRGRAVVMVLHDLCLAMRGADEIALLSQGRLAAHGTAAEVYASGQLDRVFGVALRRVETADGWQYYYA